MRPSPILTLTLALAALASAAAAPPPVRRMPPPGAKPPLAAPAPRRSVIVKPPWETLPSGDDLNRYYPEAAARRGVGGKAVIACTVNGEGRLEDCQVESETPAGQDFGAAALRMAGLFKMKSRTLDGAPVEGGRVRIPIVFSPPDPAATPAADEPSYSMKGWTTTGQPPAAAPSSGRFVHILDRAPENTVPGAALYVLLPDKPSAEGLVEVWTLIVLDLPANAPASYVFGKQTFDCRLRSVSEPDMQMFAPSGKLVGWSTREPGWTSVANTDQFLIRSLDLACGFAQPPAQAPVGLAAALADARQRFGGPGAP